MDQVHIADVLDLVFAHVRDPRILSRCTRVHRSWTAPAQRQLYHNRVVFITNRPALTSHHINAFRSTLESHPQIASYIRRLKYDIYPENRNDTAVPTRDVPLDDILTVLFEREYPHLIELRLHGVENWVATDTAFDDRLSSRFHDAFGRVMALHLVDLCFPDFSSLQILLSSLTVLTQLTIANESFNSSRSREGECKSVRLGRVTFGAVGRPDCRVQLVDWLTSTRSMETLQEINVLSTGNTSSGKYAMHRLLVAVSSAPRDTLNAFTTESDLYEGLVWPDYNTFTQMTIRCNAIELAPALVRRCQPIKGPNLLKLRLEMPQTQRWLSYDGLDQDLKTLPVFSGDRFPRLQHLEFVMLPQVGGYRQWFTVDDTWDMVPDPRWWQKYHEQLRTSFADYFSRGIVAFECERPGLF